MRYETKTTLLALALVTSLAVSWTHAGSLGEIRALERDTDAVSPRAELIEESGLVRTYSDAALVHLENGQVLRFESNTAAKLEELLYGQVKVRVLSGSVTALDKAARPQRAGAGSWFVLDPSFADPMDSEATLLSRPVDTAGRGRTPRNAKLGARAR